MTDLPRYKSLEEISHLTDSLLDLSLPKTE
jgi:hypothetical protein